MALNKPFFDASIRMRGFVGQISICFHTTMSHRKQTDEISKFFDLLYSIDQRLLREADENINKTNLDNYDESD
jgi:hypothetical protein